MNLYPIQKWREFKLRKIHNSAFPTFCKIGAKTKKNGVNFTNFYKMQYCESAGRNQIHTMSKEKGSYLQK